MRYHLAAGAFALALAGCSGSNQTAPEPTATVTEAASEAAPVASEAATEAPVALASPEPTPTPTATPTTKAAALPAPAPSAEPVKVAAAAAPPATFARCAVCHSTEKGAPDKIGPNLFGVYGKKAAQGSYAFSAALKNAGLTLDEDTLDTWIAGPMTMVPGTRMSFPGIKDEAKRKEIIAYLKQLH